MDDPSNDVAAPAAPTPAAAGSLLSPDLRATTIGVIALISVFAFEAMAVATAMPVVAEALDGLALYGLAFGGTLALSVIGMVHAGIAVDRRGTRGTFTMAAFVFLAGLLIAGFANSMAVVVLGRAVQGFGSGAAIVALYVVVDDYPVGLQKRMFAAFAGAWVVPALVGPAIAGFLAEQVHWRAVFLLVAAVVPPAAIAVRRRMRTIASTEPASPAERRRVALAVVAATGVLLLHVAGQRRDPTTVLLLAVGLTAGVAATRPLLPVGALRMARGLPAVVGMRGLAAAAFFTAEVLLPLLLTTQRGLSATAAGAVLTIGALGWSAGSWLQGRLDAPARSWVARGMLLVAASTGLVAASLVDAVPTAAVVVGWALAGAGMGLTIPTLSVHVLQLSSPGQQGRNVSSLQVSDAMAGATALAVTGSLLALGGARAQVFVAGLALSMLLALVAAVLSGRVEAPATDE